MKTPFRQVTGHAGNIRLRLILLAGLAGTMLGQGTSLCGKYSLIVTATDPPCHRVGSFPGSSNSRPVGDGTAAGSRRRYRPISFYSSLSLTSNHTNLVVEDNEFGSTFSEELSALDLGGYKSHWTRILGQCVTTMARARCSAALPVEYAGPEGSGIPGLDQMNVRLTSAVTGLGGAEFLLTVDGIPSNPVSFYFPNPRRE
jgi:hypothetical protein